MRTKLEQRKSALNISLRNIGQHEMQGYLKTIIEAAKCLVGSPCSIRAVSHDTSFTALILVGGIYAAALPTSRTSTTYIYIAIIPIEWPFSMMIERRIGSSTIAHWVTHPTVSFVINMVA